jgi:ferredoxin-thioredoxin reductase catalytic subunit
MKKYWRCTVCGDIHYGNAPPKVCPTCSQVNVYVEIERKEALNIEVEVSKLDLMKALNEFVNGKEFILNPDANHVQAVIKGLLINEGKYGLRLCPCGVRDGTRQRELELICPCNFKIQENWETRGECRCGLFKKKVK